MLTPMSRAAAVIVVIVAGMVFARAEDAPKEARPAPEEAPEPPKEAPQFPKDSTDRATASTVVIRTATGGGSGFLTSFNGETYIVTNQHVLVGSPAREIEITFADGTRAVPLSAEAAGELDLLRLRVKSDKAPLERSGNASLADIVATVGNSLDAGVVTVNPGRVVGIAAGEVEVDCDLVPGQSGGPVVNSDGAVIGVNTYLILADKEATSQGTRYAKNRNFAVRITDDISWTPIPAWDAYAKLGATVNDADRTRKTLGKAADLINEGSKGITADSKVPTALQSAITDYNHFAGRFNNMVGEIVTPGELERNNRILAASYRNVFNKLRIVCTEELARLRRVTVPPQYPWLKKESQKVQERLSKLEQFLDQESKGKPRFLKFN
jgi:S1-C subfamily serine protease